MIRSIALRCKNNTKVNGKWKISNNVDYKRVKFKWDDKYFSLCICDLVPSNKNNVEELEMKNMNIIKDITKTKYDFVIFGIGYLDSDKILKSFNRADLLQTKRIDSIHSNLKKANGQYISIVQQCLLLKIPHFFLGRDRLTELTSIGTAIFSNPKEIFSLLYYFLINSEKNGKNSSTTSSQHKRELEDKEYNLQFNAPNFYNALIVENALYLIYNIHATLLKIVKSKYYIPPHGSTASTSTSNYTNTSNGINNTDVKKNVKQIIFSFFNETTYDQINNIRNQIRRTELFDDYIISTDKTDINILIVCDSISVDYFYNYLQKNLYLWHTVSPFYNELFALEKKNIYKFVLSLFLFIIAPLAWALTFLIRYLYYLWVEYFTKGKVITVGGDLFFQDSKLVHANEHTINSEDNYDKFINSINNNTTEFEKVSLLGGLLQWFKNKSRN
ncbi:conserved Plasmodium protein, unknown function [Plasmodium malariae]|uniref:Uncharacterized protein n=1 Tax=Plasmodium malariae TaxID=5858 RepID=A0A1C3L1J3_PLAMA|nr:conserved Plasmodium protein, unknown function [Plasmodium malariae]